MNNDPQTARRSKRIFTIFPYVFAIVCFTAAQAWGNWPQFRGPERDGIAATGPTLLSSWPDDGPSQLWVYDQLGEGYSSAAITDDGIYVTGMEGETGFMYALDHNGQLKWKTAYGPEWERSYRGSRTTPTVYNGKLYLMSGYGLAACLDAESGDKIWSVDTDQTFGARNIRWGITESPLVLEDKVIFSPGGPEAGIVALHPETGETVWVCEDVKDRSGYCSPILVEHEGRRIIAQLMATTFVGIDADTGELLWRKERQRTPAHNIQAVSPVFSDGLFYITSGYGGERGVMLRLDITDDSATVTPVWRDSELDCQHGGVILYNGFIYGASDRNNRNHWVCLNLRTGDVAGKIRGVGKGSVSFADGMLYTLSERGQMGLVRADPENFAMVSSFQVPSGGSGPHWAHPSIANGRLYIRHASSLFVYDLTNR